MDFTQFVVGSPRSEFVELTNTRSGRVFRKHILTKGDLIHPVTKETVRIDDAFVTSLTQNFHAGVCDIVQVPVAGDHNEHTEDPDRNIGEVVGLESEGDKIYATFEARDPDRAEKLGKTLLGASAMINLNYTDTRTGKKVGPTLLHMAVTNRPYVVGLEDFQEVLAATSDNSDEPTVLLTPVPRQPLREQKDDPQMPMTKDEMFVSLKAEYDIDVPALVAAAAAGEVGVQLTNTLAKALSASGMLELSNTDDPKATSTAVIQAVVDLAKENVELTNASTEAEVDALVLSGHILPAQKDSFLELRRENKELFTKLIPPEPLVKLSVEKGVTPQDEGGDLDVDAEIARIIANQPPTKAKTG